MFDRLRQIFGGRRPQVQDLGAALSTVLNSEALTKLVQSTSNPADDLILQYLREIAGLASKTGEGIVQRLRDILGLLNRQPASFRELAPMLAAVIHSDLLSQLVLATRLPADDLVLRVLRVLIPRPA